jgi:putative two-component system response regulator
VGARILVVDDDPVARSIYVVALKSQGYDVEPVGCAEDALACLRSEAFDLLITDLMMPSIDGIELAKAIRRDQRLVDLPILFITSLDDRETRIRVLELGAPIMTKPVDLMELYVCLDRLLLVRTRIGALRECLALMEGTRSRAKLGAMDADGVCILDSEPHPATLAPPRDERPRAPLGSG